MLPGFEALVEERIQKAQKKGDLNNLPGKGKPLDLTDMRIPDELRMAHRVLKNAGFLPPEVELRKQIEKTESMLSSLSANDPSQEPLKKRLNFLLTKLNTSRGMENASPCLPGRYRNALNKRIS